MSITVTRAPWPKLATSCPTLPGGTEASVATLREVLRAFGGIAPSPLVADGPSADRILKQIGVLGLTVRTAAGIELTPLACSWLDEPTNKDLASIMHARIAYFGELLARIAEAPARIEDLQAHAAAAYQLPWTSPDQVRRRLGWLHALRLVEDGPQRLHRITPEGQSVLTMLEVVQPQELSGLFSAHDDEVLSSAPPLLAIALARTAPSRRSLAWPYFTKDPVTALTVVAEATATTTTKESAVELLSDRFDISASSAKSFIDVAGTLGVYEYTGKHDITITPLGREWLTTGSWLNLIRLIHVRYAVIGEILTETDDQQPRGSGEIHALVFAGVISAPKQNRTAGVLRFLTAAGAVTSIGYARYVRTAIGRALLEELPLVPPKLEDGAHDPAPPADQPEAALEDFVEELEQSARDSGNPARFEKACAATFSALGVEAQHVGGPGRTDVVVTIHANLALVARAIIDAKSSAGQLNENSVKFPALREHAALHEATLLAVVAPGYEGTGRLSDWAREAGVVLLTATELADILRAHASYPFSATDVAGLLTVDGREDVLARRKQALDQLSLFTRVMEELVLEARRGRPEPIAARDIGRAIRRDGLDVSDDEVALALSFLAQPEIGAVQATRDGTYTIPSAPSVAAGRLRALARSIERAFGSQ